MKTPCRALMILVSLSLPALAVAEEGASAATAATAGYDKGFFIRDASGLNELKLGGYIKLKLNRLIVDGPGDRADFSLPNARLVLKGKVLIPGLKFKFQAEFGKGKVSLKDYHLDYTLLKDWLTVRAGQFKVPYGRSFLTSSTKLEFIDRPATSKYFRTSRDVGVAAYSTHKEIEYMVGLFNGSGEGVVPNFMNPTLAIRAAYNFGGIKTYSQGDLEGGDVRFAVGGSVVMAMDSYGRDAWELMSELDAELKYEGLAIVAEAFFMRTADTTTGTEVATGHLGANIQASYAINKMWQPLVRYTVIAPDGGEATHSPEIGFTFFSKSHNFKLQAGYLLEIAGADVPLKQVLTAQVMLAF